MDRTDQLALVKDINENLCFVKNNFEQANRCAGQMRSALNSAVKLFWLKKHGKIPVWVENNVETFSLYRAAEDVRFSQYFNKLEMSDIRALRQMCNDALHDVNGFALDVAQELFSRLEHCIKAIEKKIDMTIITSSAQKHVKSSNTQVPVSNNVYYTSASKSNEYSEPDFPYIIIKTKHDTVRERGSLYEATRWAWKVSLDTASRYRYVFSVIDGIVQEVFVASKWLDFVSDNPKNDGRIEFIGTPASTEISSKYVNKLIPAIYRKKGMASPFLYSKNNKM